MTSIVDDQVTDDDLFARDRAQRGLSWSDLGCEEVFRHEIAAVNGGIRLHYVIGGDGPVLVVLHGFPQSWREWRYVMPLLVEAGYTIIAPDLRGFGESDKPLDGYDVVTVSEDLYHLITQLGVQPIGLIGHDAGASVAYAWAAAHPEQVRQLALIEAIPAGLEPPGTPGGPTRHGEPLWHPAFFRTPDLPETLITGREEALVSYFLRQSAYDRTAFTDDDIRRYAAALASLGALRGALAHHRARPLNIIRNHEFAQRPLTMPVLAIGAMQSFATRIADAARGFATDVTGVVASCCGHWIPEERPVWLAHQLSAFLQPVEPTPGR
jgi:pimeloyl-ACP methyl ester carboxylesterase